ncbi:MAG: hypothetical protein NTX15_09760 [Candidatus Kapabacteria bacterium]|nr:hypothetical protein [Candidatus Kapabacteria bacterium]
MRIIAAGKALWHGVRAPWRVQEATSQAATAIFAVAVLLIVAVSTWCAILENGDPALVAESRTLSQLTEMLPVAKDAQLDLSTPQRQFTGALGGALMVTIGTTAALAGFFLIAMRFMTNAPVTYSMAIVAVSSSAIIQGLDLLVSVAGHIYFHSARAGLHAGLFVSPIDAPMLFTWLQRISLFSLWQYIAIAIALSTWGGLHRRYGIVVGAVVWFITRLILGAFTLVSWVVSLQKV